MQVVQHNSEFVVTGLLSRFVKGFYILLTHLNQLLIHLVVLLRYQLNYTHCSADFLANLVEIRSFAGCRYISTLYVFLSQLAR